MEEGRYRNIPEMLSGWSSIFERAYNCPLFYS
jgi:hypothetical protein